MANYNGLPGLEAIISDGGIPNINSGSNGYSAQAKTEPILIIAPAGVDTPLLRALHTSDAELDLTKINSVSDFGASTKIGTYTSGNKIATAYRKAVDAGSDNVYAVALRGANQYEKYLFLHDLYATLEDSTLFDIVVLDDTVDVFADTKLDIGEITVAALTSAPDAIGLYYVKEGVSGEDAITEGKFVDNEKELYAGQVIYVSALNDVAVANIAVEADTEVFTKAAHGFLNGDYVKASASTLDEIANDAYFYVIDKTTDTFKLSLTENGEAIAITDEDGTVTLTRKAPVFKSTQFYDRQLFEKDFDITFSTSVAEAKVEFAKQFAGFCKVLSLNTNTVIGLIAVQPPVDTSIAGIRNYVKSFEGIVYEYNGYIQVVTGPKHNFIFNGEAYSDMWTSAYAGMIASRPSYSSPTNRTIPGILTTTYELSKRQQLTILQAHGVVTKQRSVGDVAVVDAVTSAPDNTDFVRLTTVRIMKDVVNLIREIGDPYIGEPNSLEKRNALEASIKNGLNNMIKAGAIQKFNCFINASNIDIISGNMKIFVEFVPQFETRNIKLAIGLKPTL